MKLIIEAGGTKSSLVYTRNRETLYSFTESGLNLTQENTEDFEKRILKWSSLVDEKVDEVYVFAAGDPGEPKKEQLLTILSAHFKTTKVSIQTDLLAACYATAGNNSGIVAILGTGSNSCYYDGKNIVKNVPPGGFILGDEGSGAYIGKQILIDYLRSKIPGELREQLQTEFQLTPAAVIQNVYGNTIRNAAMYCSSFLPFVIKNMSSAYCHHLASKAALDFMQFVKNNYGEQSTEIYLVGSAAYYMGDILHAQAKSLNIKIIKIIQHPIQDLCLFLAAS